MKIRKSFMLVLATILAIGLLAWSQVPGGQARGTIYIPSVYSLVFGAADSATNVFIAKTADDVATVTGALAQTTFNTAANCSSSAAPAVCAAAPAGSVVIAAAATTVTVNTTAVTANSQILVSEDVSLGTKLSVTCNTTAGRTYAVTARTAATSFVITTDAAPTTNPACLGYTIIN